MTYTTEQLRALADLKIGAYDEHVYTEYRAAGYSHPSAVVWARRRQLEYAANNLHDLAEECLRLRAALEWYSNEKNWLRVEETYGGCIIGGTSAVGRDGGARARAALAPEGGE